MSTQTPDQDQDPSDQAKPDELEETMNASVDENNAEQDPLEQAAAKLAECEETTQRAKDDLLRVQAEMQNVRRRADQDAAFRDGDALRLGLGGDIDHAGGALGVDMGELAGHAPVSRRRVAAAMSASRISASPTRKQRTP